MKTTLQVYLARPRRGHWEASIPWGGPLSTPVRGPSPAQLKERLMFQASALVQSEQRDEALDALVAPLRAELRDVTVRLPDHLVVEGESTTVLTRAVLTQWAGDTLWRAWLPHAPDVCLAVDSPDDVAEAAAAWAADWDPDDPATAREALEADFPAELDTVEVDLEAAETREETASKGRLAQPEALREVADNLVHRADDDRLDEAFGRESVVEKLVEVITGTEASHLCIVGPAGAGKTAIIDEAVRRSRELQHDYQQRRDVWRTSGDRMIAGMSRVGQWEERARRVCRELSARGDILVVGDLLGLIRAGRSRHGGAGVARFIEPHVHQGDFSVVVEATERTFDVARAQAPGFVESLRRVPLEAMSEESTLEIVNALARKMEGDHPVRFTPDGIEASLRLSRRYFRREVFPGKAVRLMRHCLNDALRRRVEGTREEAGGTVRIRADDVSEVVHRRTGLPMRILKPDAGRRPGEVREAFESRVYDQPEATEVVTDLVVAVEQGMCDPRHPLASLLLIGPSGVGKTETAKTLADELFGSEERLTRFDMSEFAEPAAATRLIGTAESPEGELTGRVRVQPFTLLLFDEIEKAHPSVLDLLLQLLGDGRLTDAAGRTVDFTNTVVAMTSNLGAEAEERWVGFQGEGSDRQADRALHYRRAAEDFFRPEMFNRIGRIVPFRPLGHETLRRIARRTMRELMDRRGLRQSRVMVDVSPDLVEHLVGGAVDDRYGARTLGHRIERKLIAPLARQLTTRGDTEGLTRVTLQPGATGEADVRMHELDEALPMDGPLPEGVRDARPRSETLVPKFRTLVRAVHRLADSDPAATLESQRQKLLDAINNDEPPEGDDDALDRGERLRQREIVRGNLRALVERVDSLPDGSELGETGFGETNGAEDLEGWLAQMADAPRSQLHEWAQTYGEIARELAWVANQIRELRRYDIGGGTLVWTALSGPAHRILEHGWQLLSTWAVAHEVDMITAIRRGGPWTMVPADEGFPGGSDIMAAAFSAEHPGVGLLFEWLQGYVFAPQPPTHGRHALSINEFKRLGTSEPDALLEQLSKRSDKTPAPEEAHVEFVIEEGRLRDNRLAIERKLPGSSGPEARELLERLIAGRLGGTARQLFETDAPHTSDTREES